ncbi:MAG: molybdenum cofactor guanylyltransferase [Pyrinomonadaceae bacterium]
MFDDQARDIEGFILAGGASSRMGTNKAELKLAGRTFVACISDALSFVASRTRVVGASGKAASNNLQIVPDVYAKWGALGGVHAALHACNAEWALIVACDMPFASAEFFVRLASLRGNFDAVAPVQADGRPQPLCALYRVAACRDTARTLIEKQERRPRVLLQTVRTRWAASEEFFDLKNAAILLMNVNTPEEYEQALETQSSRNDTSKGE